MSHPELIGQANAVMPRDPDNPTVRRLHTEIATQDGITYEQFMEVCLYGRSSRGDAGGATEELGYYSSGRAGIGAGADFATHADTTSAYGGTIAHYAHDVWQQIGSPDRLWVVEQGAGNGAQAAGFLQEVDWQVAEGAPADRRSFGAFRQAARHLILEYGGGMIAHQQQRLQGNAVNWVHGSAIDLPLMPKGKDTPPVLFTSTELPDTFPVARVRKRVSGFRIALEQVYVTMTDRGAFYEETRPIEAEDLAAEARTADSMAAMADGEERVFNMRLQRWSGAMGSVLRRTTGGVLTIDYGHHTLDMNLPPRIYHHSVTAPYGSAEGQAHMYRLQYELPGEVDITTSVPFRAHDAIMRRHGLRPHHITMEADFLRYYGFETRLHRVVAAEVAAPNPVLEAMYAAQRQEGDNRSYEAFVRDHMSSFMHTHHVDRTRSFMAYAYRKTS